MKLSRKWLNEFVPVDVTDKQYAEAMTLSGSKVESVETPGGDITGVVVGRVLSQVRHENADNLFVCTVDIGKDTPLTIVTAAKNVNVGDLVPVAADGATLSGSHVIKAGQLRGVMSEGMMCSLKELGLTVNDFPYGVDDGIFIIQEPCQAGDDAVKALGIDDSVFDFEITNNRPDCFSIIGLARETAATLGGELKLHTPVVRGNGQDILDVLDIEIEDGDLCPRYTARMVTNVKIEPSPRWMRERLRASGVRPINNIVDITNYVMLEYGQPMHAFDFACVEGGKIVVRRVRPGEAMTTLDDIERKLTENMLMIADTVKPVGIAGVMGGANSEITGKTVNVVFESATFDGASVRQTAIALGMRTDASSRFEKGLDPLNTLPAVNRACELVELLQAGEVLDGVVDVITNVPEPTVLKLEPDRINRLLGTNIPCREMEDMLLRLGFTVDGDNVHVPSWRPDVGHMADLSEEIARLYGYNKIPTTMFRAETSQGGFTEAQKTERLCGSVCRSLGYSEILTYSFVSPSSFDKIRIDPQSPLRDAIEILNPLGEDTSIMRTTPLPSMLEILSRNNAYRNKSAKLYEMARIYLKTGGPLAYEPQILSLGSYGTGGDFFTMKGEIEALFTELNLPQAEFTADTANPSYHPGRCARILINGAQIGVIGQIHPLAAGEYDIDAEVYCAELNYSAMLEHIQPAKPYVPLPRYPSVTRDISVVCDDSVTAAELTACIKRGGSELLKSFTLFDVYKGGSIAAGKKSAAFSLNMRSDERTLTDADADAEVARILELLESSLGATIR